LEEQTERSDRKEKGASHSKGGARPEMVRDVRKEAGEDDRHARCSQPDESELVLRGPFASGPIAETRSDASETRERDLSDAF
jgi:hypothetical protein